jgi:hypothetical protein
MAQCIICTHDDRLAIDAALMASRSLRDIAGQFNISKSSVARHKEHLSADLVQAHQEKEGARADDLLGQIRQIHNATLSILSRAYKSNEDRIALAAVREARGNMELLAKMLGQLQDQPTVNVLVASPEWTATRARLLAALAPYPDARTAVVEAIRESGR